MRATAEGGALLIRGALSCPSNPFLSRSPIEMFVIRDGRPGGERFDRLHNREKYQVLRDYVSSYEEFGISYDQRDQVFFNIVADGKPRDRWLEGTSPAEITLSNKRTMEAFRKLAESLREEKPRENAKSLDRNIGRER